MLQQYHRALADDDTPPYLSDQPFFLDQSAFFPPYACGSSEQSLRGTTIPNSDSALPSSHLNNSDTPSQLPLDPLFIYPEHSILSLGKDEEGCEELPEIMLSESQRLEYCVNSRDKPPSRILRVSGQSIATSGSKSAVRRCITAHLETQGSVGTGMHGLAATAARSRANSCPISAETAVVTPQAPIAMPTRQLAALRLENEDDNSMNGDFESLPSDQQGNAMDPTFSKTGMNADISEFLQHFCGIDAFNFSSSPPTHSNAGFRGEPDWAHLVDSYDILADQNDASFQLDHSRRRPFPASTANGLTNDSSLLHILSSSEKDDYDYNEMRLASSEPCLGYMSFNDHGVASGNANPYHGDEHSMGDSDMLVASILSSDAADFTPPTPMIPSHPSGWPSVPANGINSNSHTQKDHPFSMSPSVPTPLAVASGNPFRSMMNHPSQSQNCLSGAETHGLGLGLPMGYSMATSSMFSMMLDSDCVTPAATEILSTNNGKYAVNGATGATAWQASGRPKKHGRDDTDGVPEISSPPDRQQMQSSKSTDEGTSKQTTEKRNEDDGTGGHRYINTDVQGNGFALLQSASIARLEYVPGMGQYRSHRSGLAQLIHPAGEQGKLEVVESVHGQRAAIQRYLQSPADQSIISVMILTSKVAQKSYGTEKRFLCPPPTVLFLGNGWGRGLSTFYNLGGQCRNHCDSIPTSVSPSTEKSFLDNIYLSVGISGESTQQQGVIEWCSGAISSSPYPSPFSAPATPNSSADQGWCWDESPRLCASTYMSSPVPINGTVTGGSNGCWQPNSIVNPVPLSSIPGPCPFPCAPPLQVAGTCVSKHLFINDADEKRKHVQVEVSVKLKARGVGEEEPAETLTSVGCFTSRPVKVISKPSKKRQSVKNMELCIHHGTTISLFNRIRSQTVSTKYLGVSTSPSHFNSNSPSPSCAAASPTTTLTPPPSHTTPPQTPGTLPCRSSSSLRNERANRANQFRKKASNTFEGDVNTHSSRLVARTSGWDPFVIWIVDPRYLSSDSRMHPPQTSTGSSFTPGVIPLPPAIALQTQSQYFEDNFANNPESASCSSSPMQNGRSSANLSTSPSSTRQPSRANSINRKVSSPALSSKSPPNPIPIHYNQPVILQSLTTGFLSPVMVIRKVDKGSMVMGGLPNSSASMNPNTTGSTPTYPSTGFSTPSMGCQFEEQLGDPVSQLHKVALQIYQYPQSPLMTCNVGSFTDTSMANPCICPSVFMQSNSDLDTIDTRGIYLACLGDVVGKQRAQDGRKWVHPVTGAPVDHPPSRTENKCIHADFAGGSNARNRYLSQSYNSLPVSPSSLSTLYDSYSMDDPSHMSTPQPTQSEFGKVVRKRRVSSCSEIAEILPASPALPVKNRNRRRVSSCSSTPLGTQMAASYGSSLEGTATSGISMSTPDASATPAVWCEDATDSAVWTIVGTDAVQYTLHCPELGRDNDADASGTQEPPLPMTPVPTVHHIHVAEAPEPNARVGPARPIVTLHGDNFTSELTVWFGDIKAVGTELQSPELLVCLGPTSVVARDNSDDSDPGDSDSQRTGSLYANVSRTSVPVLLVRDDGVVYRTGKSFML